MVKAQHRTVNTSVFSIDFDDWKRSELGWVSKSKTVRRYYCPNDGDLTDRLSSYTNQMDIGWCPDCGTRLTIVLSDGGDHMTKKKLKVMTEIKNNAPKLREAKGMKPVKAKHAQEVTKTNEPDAEVEKAFEALRKLGGKATSPELVKELGFEGETARDKVRRLMGKLHDAHRIHRNKGDKGYTFEIAEPKVEPAVEAAPEAAAA